MPGSKRRMRQTVRYQEWMSAQAALLNDGADANDAIGVDEVSRAVREALENLNEKERTAIERFHFMGAQPELVALELCVTKRGLERILRRAKLKLQSALFQFAKKRWQITASAKNRNCPLCESPDRKKIERLLETKKPQETWKRIQRDLQDQFGINVPAPQTIIGHVRYHNVREVEKTGKGNNCEGE